MKKALMMACVIFLVACGKNETETKLDELSIVTAEESVEQLSETDNIYEGVIGLSRQDAIKAVEEMGFEVYDGLNGEYYHSGTAEDRRRAFFERTSRFEMGISDDVEVYCAQGSTKDSNIVQLVMYIQNNVLVAYDMLMDFDMISVNEYKGKSVMPEIRTLTSEPSIENLRGRNNDGNAWNDSFNGRIVYNEVGYTVQMHVMKYDFEQVAATMDVGKMSLIQIYVEKEGIHSGSNNTSNVATASSGRLPQVEDLEKYINNMKQKGIEIRHYQFVEGDKNDEMNNTTWGACEYGSGINISWGFYVKNDADIYYMSTVVSQESVEKSGMGYADVISMLMIPAGLFNEKYKGEAGANKLTDNIYRNGVEYINEQYWSDIGMEEDGLLYTLRITSEHMTFSVGEATPGHKYMK